VSFIKAMNAYSFATLIDKSQDTSNKEEWEKRRSGKYNKKRSVQQAHQHRRGISASFFQFRLIARAGYVCRSAQ